MEGLERRVLLSYSPGGDGAFGEITLSGTTLGGGDRITLDVAFSPTTMQSDVVNVTGAVTLGGLLSLNTTDLSGIKAGDRVDLLKIGAGGGLQGAFHAVTGLAANDTLDFAVIQGPDGVSIVATALPTGDFTIAVDTAAEFQGLVDFFAAGTGSASLSQDSIRGLGQVIAGNMTFTAATDGQTMNVSLLTDADASKTGRVLLNGASANLFEIYGSGLFHVGQRGTEDSGLRRDSFTTTGYTLAASLGGTGEAATSEITGKVGPLSLEKANASLSAFVLDGQNVRVTAGFVALKATVAFTGSSGAAPAGGSPSGLAATADAVEASISFAGAYDTTTTLLTPLDATGGFVFTARSATLDLPGGIKASAESGLTIGYDPEGGASQELISIPILTVDLTRFGVRGSVTPAPDSTDPGLVIRQDGFRFGNLTGQLRAPGDAAAIKVKFGRYVEITNPSLSILNYGYTVGGNNSLDGAAISIGATEARIGPPSGSFYVAATDVAATLTFGADNLPSGLGFRASSFSAKLGEFITASSGVVAFDPTAADDAEMLTVAETATATLKLGAIELTGTAGKFAVLGNGTFLAKDGFNVGFAVSADALGGMKFPSFLSSASASVTVAWPSFSNSPDRFLMQLSAAVSGQLGKTSPVALSGSITNLTIDSQKIVDGEFPIIGIGSASITASGNVFGGRLEGTLALGTVIFDDNGERLPDTTYTTDPDAIADSTLWAAVSGGFTIVNKAGFKLMVGVSERGLLQAYVRADVPVLLDPISGLTIDGFRGGVTFNATAFPEITDPISLRSPLFSPTSDLTDAEWLESLQALVVNQKGGNPGFLFEFDPAEALPTATSGEWASVLNTARYPEVAFDAKLLEIGHAVSKKLGDVTVTVLDPGNAWILDDRGTQFLIEKTPALTFNFTAIGASFDGAYVDALPTAAATKTAAEISATDADGETATLVQIFAGFGVALGAGAVVSYSADDEAWQIDDNGTIFVLETRGVATGGGTEVLIVTGGNGTFGRMDQVIKIEAGATFYSSYVGKEFFKIEADVIVTTDGNFLFDGDAHWLTDPITGLPKFTQSVKIYLQSTNLAAAAGKVFFLTDMPVSNIDPAAGMFSAHGVLSFGFLDAAGNTITSQADLEAGRADSFRINLAGSETQGLAVIDLAGFQRLRLGGKLDPSTGIQYGQATLNIKNTQITFDYNANVSSEGLIAANSFIKSSGKFILNFENGFDVWGAAILEATADQIAPLKLAGVSGDAKAQFQVNTTNMLKDVVLLVPNEGNRTIRIQKESAGLFIAGALAFAPPVVGGTLHQEIVGAFALQGSSTDGFSLLVLGSAPISLPLIGSVSLPLRADVLGAIVINSAGIAGRLELNLRDRVGAGIGEYFDFDAAIGLYINSTGAAQQVVVPAGVESFLREYLPATLQAELVAPTTGDGLTVQIAAGAPKLDGTNEPAGAYLVLMANGGLRIADTFDLNGNFRIAYRNDATTDRNFFELDANAQMTLAPLGTVTATGTLVIEDMTGDMTDLNVQGAFQLAGTLRAGPLSFAAYAGLEFNSHNASKNVVRYYDPATRTATTTPVLTAIAGDTLQLFVGGSLQWSNATIASGGFTFVKSGGVFTMTADAVMNLAPLSQAAVTGSLQFSSDGVAGALTVAGGVDFDIVKLSGVASIELNTYATPVNVSRYYNSVTKQAVATPVLTSLPGQTLRIFVGGELKIGTVFTLHGSAVLLNTPQKLSVSFDAELRAFFGSTTLNVLGSAEIYKGSDAGLVLDIGVSNVNFGVDPIFSIKAQDVFLRVNTRDAQTLSSAGHLINGGLIELSIGKVEFELFREIKLAQGSASVRLETSGRWDFFTSASVNFFGVATLGGSFHLYSTGEFSVVVDGAINLGGGGTGIFGTAHIEASYLATNAADTNALTPADMIVSGNGSFSGKLFGITLLGLTANFTFNGSTGELKVKGCVEINLLVTTITECAEFTIGFFKVPPPVYLAGTAGDSSYSQSGGYWQQASAWTGGQLHLNVGDRGKFRNLAVSTTDEFYFVSRADDQSDAAAGTQNLKVSGMGRTQVYRSVSGLTGNFGSGNDYVEIAPEVTVPVTLSGGDGNDQVFHHGSGSANLSGDNGNDVLVSGNAAATLAGGAGNDQITGGKGADSITAGTGNDIIIWRAGDGSDTNLDAGEETGDADRLVVMLTNQKDYVAVTDPATGQFEIRRTDAAGVTVETLVASAGFEAFTLEASGEADQIRIGDLADTGLTSVVADLTRMETGTVNVQRTVNGNTYTTTIATYTDDTTADILTIDGNSSADTFTLSTATDANDVDRDGATTAEQLLNIVRNTNLYTITLVNAKRANGDAVVVTAKGGADNLNATAVAADVAAITLAGDDGNDVLVGSSFNDHLSGGLGDDTYIGGVGTDTFADDGGNDTLIETRDSDFTLTSGVLVIGAMTDTAGAYAATAEFEQLLGIFERATLSGGAGNNKMVVGDDNGAILHGTVSKTVSRSLIPTVTLNGAGGGDAYVVWSAATANATINVLDTGATSEGTDVLTVHGTDAADQFLLRSDFVAMLAGATGNGGFATAERVNFNGNIEGSLTVNGRAGNNKYAIDDTGVTTTLNGGEGNDAFQIGQMFEADRLPPHVALDDSVNTTLTTVGYLTDGNSHQLTANGGNGKDDFTVFRNTAPLTLNGDADSDTFTVRAFTLAGSGASQELTNVNGGSGDDLVSYAENALVGIDGGEGYDILRALGTEFSDRFLVTSSGISGAGLNIGYVGVESVELHGGDGSDQFYILSTSAAVKTTIYGGAGSDHFFVGAIDPARHSDATYADYLNEPRSLAGVQGPLFLDGGVGDPLVFNIPTPIMFLGETDIADGGHASDGSQQSDEQVGDVDVIDVVNLDATANDTGALTSTNLSGLGMGDDLVQEIEPDVFQTVPGGISYNKFEILDVQLGSGSETLNVQSVAMDLTTLLRGNGGDDKFVVTAGEAANAMLAIFGDAAASDTFRGSAGNDTIDASTSAIGATYDGGAGNDSITGGRENDRIAGGSGNDTLGGGAGDDLIWGDSGFDVNRNTRITTVVTSAGVGDDTINVASGRDFAFGDHGELTQSGGTANVLAPAGIVVDVQTNQRTLGGNDAITASGAGENYLFGGAGNDTITGGDDTDVILGDHGRVQFNLDGDPSTLDLINVLDTHIGGNDTLAGGAGNDIILGQTGADTIGGGAGNDVLVGDNATIARAGTQLAGYDLRQRYALATGGALYDAAGNMTPTSLAAGAAFADPLGVPHLSVELLEHDAATDANRYGADTISGETGNDVLFGQLGDDTLDGGLNDDYIEGNGGSDTIRGGLGQDDLIGGSSDRFGLLNAARRRDGNDRIFGGDGTKTGRDEMGDLTSGGHGRDADVILGDNGNTYRVVTTGGTPVTFNYDSGESIRIQPRVVRLLDYTPGVAGATDIGGADLIHGEDGDDFVWGMTGNDLLFGGGNDDDVIGGAGADWISGGAGEDGILGDDGRILTSRNGTAEPLHGVAKVTALNEKIKTSGGAQWATINIAGKLKKSAILTPFELGGDDIVYGGLGDDGIHGGSGDDALSGAEALPTFYAAALNGLEPMNSGNALQYGAKQAGEFAAYDENAPRQRIDGFFLNFDKAEADGNDAIFGDGGNDWLVGGTGQDHLYGGMGDDLLNVDDNLDTTNGTNDAADTGALAGADTAFGGGGRDVLIGNSPDDRLIDWVGEFNSYIVPFSPFGISAVSRLLEPGIPEYLLKLAASDGMDLTRIEPDGELGIVRQKDASWRNQTGAPADPQPGSGGGKSK